MDEALSRMLPPDGRFRLAYHLLSMEQVGMAGVFVVSPVDDFRYKLLLSSSAGEFRNGSWQQLESHRFKASKTQHLND